MKRSFFLPILIIIGFLSYRPLNATNDVKNSKFQSCILTTKNKFYSPKSKLNAFLDAVRIKRSFRDKITNKFLWHGRQYQYSNTMDYEAAQFWLDHGVEISQELKDNKLREAIYYRTCAGIKFWLDNGASLVNLTKDCCKNGLDIDEGSVWIATDVDQKIALYIMRPDGMPMSTCVKMGCPPYGGDMYGQVLGLLKNYGVCEVIDPICCIGRNV